MSFTTLRGTIDRLTVVSIPTWEVVPTMTVDRQNAAFFSSVASRGKYGVVLDLVG